MVTNPVSSISGREAAGNDVCKAAIGLTRALARATAPLDAVGTFVLHAVCFPGVIGLRFEPEANAFSLHPFTFLVEPLPENTECRARVEAGGRLWGTIGAWFAEEGEENRKVAEILGQQLALALNTADLLCEIAEARKRLGEIEETLHTRKALQRAAGVIARRHSIAMIAAESRIRAMARRTGRGLKAIAEEVIESEALERAGAVEGSGPARLLA